MAVSSTSYSAYTSTGRYIIIFDIILWGRNTMRYTVTISPEIHTLNYSAKFVLCFYESRDSVPKTSSSVESGEDGKMSHSCLDREKSTCHLIPHAARNRNKNIPMDKEYCQCIYYVN